LIHFKDGKVEWEQKASAYEMAVDGKTGEIWTEVPGEKFSIQVLDANSGKKLRELKLFTTALAYSAQEDCFWLVVQRSGQGPFLSLVKVDRTGKQIGKAKDVGQYRSLAVDPRDGAVWVMDLGREFGGEVGGGKLICFNADGTKRYEQKMQAWGTVIDASRDALWVLREEGLAKLNGQGQVVKEIPVKGTGLGLEKDTGCVWVAGPEGVWRVGPDGMMIWGHEMKDGKQRWVCMVGGGL